MIENLNLTDAGPIKQIPYAGQNLIMQVVRVDCAIQDPNKIPSGLQFNSSSNNLQYLQGPDGDQENYYIFIHPETLCSESDQINL